MICKCGGLLNVINVEEYPENIPKHQRTLYNRLCDVQCMKCGVVYYSQPYDFGNLINAVRKLDKR